MSRILSAFLLSVWCCVTTSAQEKVQPSKPSKGKLRQETRLLAAELKGQAAKKYDRTSVAIETDELGISVAWAAPKTWELAIGQSLHHALVSDKQPCVILLRMHEDEPVVQRCQDVCRLAGIRLMLRDVAAQKTTDGYTPDREELSAIAAIRKQGVAALRIKAAIRGIVVMDGKPLASGKIMFHPAKGEPISAKINEDGAYAAEVPVGEMRVTIDFPRLPKKYTDPDAAALSVRVKPGDNTIRIELTSK
jgi:hypothetical protein